ncbi:hypothetical protein DIPPA_10106 [Diplonema papillatum]|nr:hypothetical protein DIPPA_10106 [Diplonema papillatum]
MEVEREGDAACLNLLVACGKEDGCNLPGLMLVGCLTAGEERRGKVAAAGAGGGEAPSEGLSYASSSRMETSASPVSSGNQPIDMLIKLSEGKLRHLSVLGEVVQAERLQDEGEHHPVADSTTVTPQGGARERGATASELTAAASARLSGETPPDSDSVRDHSALAIQSVYRGHHARKQHQQQLVEQQQQQQQENQQPSAEEDQAKEHSPLAIQSVYRGHHARKQHQQQLVEQQQQQQQQQENQQPSAEEDQAKEHSALAIQSVYRGHHVRKQHQQQQLEQQQQQQQEGRQPSAEEDQAKEHSALTIQSVYRGHHARKQHQQQQLEQQQQQQQDGQQPSAEGDQAKEHSALAIQAAFRGHRARQGVRGRRQPGHDVDPEAEAREHCALAIQAAFREHRSRRAPAAGGEEEGASGASGTGDGGIAGGEHGENAEGKQRSENDRGEGSENDERHRGAVAIQSVFRGRRVRQQCAAGEPTEEIPSRAALRIQLAYRRMQARLRVEAAKRAKQRERHAAHEEAAKEFAVILLQAWIRGEKVRKLSRFAAVARSISAHSGGKLGSQPSEVLSRPDGSPRPDSADHVSRVMSEDTSENIFHRTQPHVPAPPLTADRLPMTRSPLVRSQAATPAASPSKPQRRPSGRRPDDDFRDPDAVFDLGSFSPAAALPVGKRPAFVLRVTLGAEEAGWNLEQLDAAGRVSVNARDVEKTGVLLDAYYDSVNAQRSEAPNGPAAFRVFGGDGSFSTGKTELVRQRDSSALFTHFKGPAVARLRAWLADACRAREDPVEIESVDPDSVCPRAAGADYTAWVQAHHTVPLRDIGGGAAARRLARQYSDSAAMAQGATKGFEKRKQQLAKVRQLCPPAAHLNLPGSVGPLSLDQVESDLFESVYKEGELNRILESLELPVPEIIANIATSSALSDEDAAVLGLTFDDLAQGTCTAMEISFLLDDSGHLATPRPVYAIFAPYAHGDNAPSSALQNTYRLALTAAMEGGRKCASFGPLLPRSTSYHIAYPQRVIVRHVMALADVLSERDWGIDTCYVAAFDVPVEIMRRGFERKALPCNLVVHAMDPITAALRSDEPCSLLVPSTPLNILTGTIGHRWRTARGKAYRQEQQVFATSTAFLLQAQYNSVYAESARHKHVQQTALLQKPVPPSTRMDVGRLVGSKLPLATRGVKKGNLSILDRVKEAQAMDGEAQSLMAIVARQAEEAVLAARQKDGSRDSELNKLMIKERDERIRERKERRERQRELERQRMLEEEEAEQKNRRLRNRKHQEQAQAREERQKEAHHDRLRDTDDTVDGSPLKKGPEESGGTPAKKPVAADKEKDAKRKQQQRKERMAAADKEKTDGQRQRVEAIRRKSTDRALENRERRLSKDKADSLREQQKERELKQRHVPKRTLV